VTRLSELVQARGLKLFIVIDHSGEATAVGLELRDTKLVTKVSYAAPSELAARHRLSDELGARRAAIDGLTDALVGE
jgi:hypothetical protein